MDSSNAGSSPTTGNPPTASAVEDSSNAVASTEVPPQQQQQQSVSPPPESIASPTGSSPRPPSPAGTSPTSRALIRGAARGPQQVATISPMARRVAVGAGKAGMSIANGILLSRNALLNPVVSTALLAYESFRIVSDYHTGAPNALGYRTSGADVALRLGKELGMAGIGIAIGQAVGALIGLSAVPVAGQIVLTAVLSVGVGICVGTLLTRYVDRLFAKLQLRSQYRYPADEQGARRRFEQLLEERHDLTSFETCRIVQHYADYRVASGWESPNDIDDYRASGDIRQMPVSFQHFAVVQLQRKWGFLGDHSACKKVFRALMLQHHPDRGGSPEMATLLNRDYEVYAFFQGWDSDCPTLLRARDDDAAAAAAAAAAEGRPQKRNVVVDFLRSLFRQTTNSNIEASDLHEFGLLTLEAGTRSELHRLDAVAPPNADADDDDDDSLGMSGGSFGTAPNYVVSGAAKRRSIARVLAALQQTYQISTEAITFRGLAQASRDAAGWAALKDEVFLFNRLQCFVRVAQAVADEEETEEGGHDSHVDPSPPQRQHTCRGFSWATVSQAVDRREQARAAIVEAVFTAETSDQLEAALGLWQSARAMAENYYKLCASGGDRGGDDAADPATREDGSVHGARQTLDTLLSIQKEMESLSARAKEAFQGTESEWAAQNLQGFTSVMDDIRGVGLTASYVLAGEHAKTVVTPTKEACDTYFSAWDRKRRTVTTMLGELRQVRAERELWQLRYDDEGATEEELKDALEELQRRTDNFTSQLVLLQQHQAQIDAKIAELVEVCTTLLPEADWMVSGFPSTCVRCVVDEEEGIKGGRRLLHERERTLMCYQHLEVEQPSKMVSPVDYKDMFPPDVVRYTLFRATYTEPVTGTVSYCYLKSYLFLEEEEEAADAVAGTAGTTTTNLDDIDEDDGPRNDVAAPEQRARNQAQLRNVFLQQILDTELAVTETCSSKLVLAPTDLFCDPEKRRFFLQINRGATQQRFSSLYDVRKHIRPLGLRWLLDAMQCLLDLHSCQLAHGHVSLCNFTYDDFGNTAIGFFECARRLDVLRYTLQELEAEEVQKDTIDFGAMILMEVVPYLASGAGESGATQSPVTETPPAVDHLSRLFREVGERLIGKEEPRWSLLQARAFVRRCLQFDFESPETAYLFTKEITHPPYWGPLRGAVPHLVQLDRRVKLRTDIPGTAATVFLNINRARWETYWICRRKMSLGRMGSFSTPPCFSTMKPLLPCSDDCEVNERFLWHPCSTEEEAWDLCQAGFNHVQRSIHKDTRYEDVATLRFTVGGSQQAADDGRAAEQHDTAVWGVLCRVAVGTVVSTSANPSFAGEQALDAAVATAEDRITFAAGRRCHLNREEEDSRSTLLVPCPWARCYPEYVVRLSPPAS